MDSNAAVTLDNSPHSFSHNDSYVVYDNDLELPEESTHVISYHIDLAVKQAVLQNNQINDTSSIV